MLRLSVFLLTLTVSVTSMFAQVDTLNFEEESDLEKKWSYIPSIGLGASSSIAVPETGTVNYDLRTGLTLSYTGGILIERQLTANLGVQFGFQWHRIGDQSSTLAADSVSYLYYPERYYRYRSVQLILPIYLNMNLGNMLACRLGVLNSFTTSLANVLYYGDSYIGGLGEIPSYFPGASIGVSLRIPVSKLEFQFGPELRTFFRQHGQLNEKKYDQLPARHMGSLSLDMRLVF